MSQDTLDLIKYAIEQNCDNIRHADVRVIITNGKADVEEYVNYGKE